jgi:hypothetical protein
MQPPPLPCPPLSHTRAPSSLTSSSLPLSLALSRARSAQMPWPHAEALPPPRPTAPPLLWPKPRTSAPSPSLVVRATPFPGFLLSLEHPAAGLCHCEAAGARGQAITGHRGASHDCQRVRGDPRVPPRHFPDAYVLSSGRTNELRRPLPCKIATRDCMKEFDSKQGPNCNVIDSYE